MNAYERMLEVMRKQGKKDNPASIEIAYVSDGQVIHHGQKLDKDDYLSLIHIFLDAMENFNIDIVV